MGWNTKERLMVINDPHFFARDTVKVAHDLIGKLLVHKCGQIILSGIIVETEGYRGSDDPASHAYRVKTNRNAPMFGPVGCAYVYFVYGNHFCFNVVAKSSDQDAGAVLIRALKPIEGIEQMIMNRNYGDQKIIANGPGKLTQALGISREHNGCNLLTSESLYLMDPGDFNINHIKTSGRIGIRVAQERPWRFYLSRS